MTIDEAMAKAAADIDAILDRRWHELALRLIEDGQYPPDTWVWQRQQELDREWRDRTLAEIRQKLLAEWVSSVRNRRVS